MDWIAAEHERTTGIPTIYHWHEDALLTQVRDALRGGRGNSDHPA
jgi:hypothetical protein